MTVKDLIIALENENPSADVLFSEFIMDDVRQTACIDDIESSADGRAVYLTEM